MSGYLVVDIVIIFAVGILAAACLLAFLAWLGRRRQMPATC